MKPLYLSQDCEKYSKNVLLSSMVKNYEFYSFLYIRTMFHCYETIAVEYTYS